MAFNDPFVFQLGVAQPTPVFSSHSVAMNWYAGVASCIAGSDEVFITYNNIPNISMFGKLIIL